MNEPTKKRIEARLHFVPPFFSPAIENPPLLEHLWQQTEHAYLDNPLPALFKEKLGALLGRYCEAPYCLVAHSCTLRPLGMNGADIVALLSRRIPSSADTEAALARLHSLPKPVDVSGDGVEEDVLLLAGGLYQGGAIASRVRKALRPLLTDADYDNLIVFVSYSHMCHDWISAHPEVSIDLDDRYIKNYSQIAKEAPEFGETLRNCRVMLDDSHTHLAATAQARSAEAEHMMTMSERQLSDVIDRLNDAVKSAAASAEANDTTLNELTKTVRLAQDLLAIVSHDLRNPLNAIVLSAENLLLQATNESVVISSSNRILKSARRAERLIRDLLDFTQARAGGRLSVYPRPCRVDEIVATVVQEHMLAKPERAFDVEADAGEVVVDPDRLHQLLDNLVANAVAYGSPTAPIVVSARQLPGLLRLSVSNANAIAPIAPELLPTLFDPWRRGAAERVSRNRSVGLGLYIVDQIARSHGGRVTVVSDNSGTCFTAELPPALGVVA